MSGKGKQKAESRHKCEGGKEDCKGARGGGRLKKKPKGKNAYETEPKRRGTREVKR